MSYFTKTHQMDNFMDWASHMQIRENWPPGKLASWKNGLLENWLTEVLSHSII